MVQAFNPSTQEAEAGSEFDIILIYKVNSRTATATKRNQNQTKLNNQPNKKLVAPQPSTVTLWGSRALGSDEYSQQSVSKDSLFIEIEGLHYRA